MNNLLRFALIVVLLAATQSATRAATPAESPVLYIIPPAPTPEDEVDLYVRRHDLTGMYPLISKVFFWKVDQPEGPFQQLRPRPEDLLQPDFFIIRLGRLDVGRYVVDYLDGFMEGNETYLEFEVTQTGLATVVEYFNASLGHYFITADAGEIARLDGGTMPGWTRTGESFHGLPPDALPSDALRVCRYYGLPEAGLDSHFYSEDAAECEAVARRWPNQWIFETDAAFGVESTWSFYDYFCEDYHQPLYRLYNNRPDANHRYTVSPAIRDAMIAQGWILEARWFSGYPGAFTSCVPLPAPSP
jgi:hypothetical protein